MKRTEMMIKNATEMHIDYIKMIIAFNPKMKQLIPFTKHVVVQNDTILFKDYKGQYLMTFSTKEACKVVDTIIETC